MMDWKRLWGNITGERLQRYTRIKLARCDRDMDELERRMEAELDHETDLRERIRILNYLFRMRTTRTLNRQRTRY